MGIAKGGGHCLKAIYLSLSQSDINQAFEISSEKTDRNQSTIRKAFYKPLRDIKHQLTPPFAIASTTHVLVRMVFGDSLGITW